MGEVCTTFVLLPSVLYLQEVGLTHDFYVAVNCKPNNLKIKQQWFIDNLT